MKKLTLLQQMNNNKASVSWARWSWRERFDRWLQADDHVPVIEKAGTHAVGNVTYKFGRGSWMTPRTLSMVAPGVTVCAVPSINVETERYRRNFINEAIGYLEGL